MSSQSTVRAPLAASRFVVTALPFIIIIISLLVAPAPAAAQTPAAESTADPAVVAELIALNKRALADHKAGRSEAAEKTLTEALALAEKQGLATHDMAARTHVHLGIVAITGLGKREAGLRHFARAQRLKPDIKLTKQLATAALKRDFEDARVVDPDKPEKPAAVASRAPATAPAPAQAKAKEAPPVETAKEKPRAKDDDDDSSPALAAADQEPDVPVNVPQPLYCPTPIEGPPQEEVRLHCLTQNNIDARKVMLFYRPGDGERYTALPMSRTKKGWFSAIIPAKQVTGRALQFYVEARGDTGSLAAWNGKGEMPNVLVLKEGAAPVGVGALAALSFDSDEEQIDADEETPLEVREKDEERELAESQQSRRAPGRFWAGLGVGSGYGWHLRQKLERHRGRQVSAGFSPAGLAHVTPELGIQLTRRLSLSLQSRHQYLPPSGSGDPEVSGSPPQMAHAILLRALYSFYDLGDLQLVATGSAGYGSALRMVVPPAPSVGLVSSDTLVLGPGVVGPGVSAAYNFTRDLVAVIEGRTLLGMPTFGAMFEATGGVQYAF